MNTEIKVGQFAIFRGIPVGVQGINDGKAKIQSCIRLFKGDEELQKFFDIPSEVSIDKLKPFTKESAEELQQRYSGMIGKCNIILHAIKDCTSYM